MFLLYMYFRVIFVVIVVEFFFCDYYKGIVGYIDYVVLVLIDVILVIVSCLFIFFLFFLSRDMWYVGVLFLIEIVEEDFDFIKIEFLWVYYD